MTPAFFFKKKGLFLFYVCGFWLHVYMGITCMRLLPRPEKGTGSLELDLQKVVSHHMGAES